MIGTFCIWLLASCMSAVIGFVSWRSKKAVGFWNLSQKIQVSDVRKYNHAVAKMWFVFSGIFAGIGLPILTQNPIWAVITILGAVFSAIALMIVYTRIEKKYRLM